MFRLLKFCITMMHLVCLWLSYKILRSEWDPEICIGALSVSGFWLALTLFRLRQLLNTYFDLLSRLQIYIPMFFSLSLCLLVICINNHILFTLVSMLQISLWGLTYLLYRKNKLRFMTLGHGPLPKEAWVNPPAEALQAGDLILTSGRMAARLQESVGHGELVLQDFEGKTVALSSYMLQGVVIRPISAVTDTSLERGHYIALRLKKPLSPVEIKKAYELALQMYKDNDAWRTSTNQKRERFINSLPLPKSWKTAIYSKLKATGYDWPGLFIGIRASNRWTCIGACLELYKRLGVKTRQYGTGMLGLGTGLLNPIMPIRFLGDPAFQLLNTNDKENFEKQANCSK